MSRPIQARPCRLKFDEPVAVVRQFDTKGGGPGRVERSGRADRTWLITVVVVHRDCCADQLTTALQHITDAICHVAQVSDRVAKFGGRRQAILIRGHLKQEQCTKPSTKPADRVRAGRKETDAVHIELPCLHQCASLHRPIVVQTIQPVQEALLEASQLRLGRRLRLSVLVEHLDRVGKLPQPQNGRERVVQDFRLCGEDGAELFVGE